MITRAPLETIMPDALQAYGGTRYTVAHGYTSEVGIVSDAQEPYVIKNPLHSNDGVALRTLTEEQAALAHLAGTPDCPLQLPRPYGMSSDPLYARYSKVPGTQLAATVTDQPAAVMALPRPMQRELGQDLGNFMAWQHHVLTPEVFLASISTTAKPKADFDGFYNTYLRAFDDPRYPTLSHIARQCWAQYAHYYPNGIYGNGDRVNHFDLQAHNMTVENGRLASVYDWSGVEIGNINQELRGAYRMGQTVLEAAMAELAHHGIAADLAHITFWSNLRTIGALCLQVLEATTHGPAFRELADLTREAFPNEDWQEL